MFDRIVDNSKIISVAGIKSSSLISLEEGITSELGRYLKRKTPIKGALGANAKMDRLVGGCPSLRPVLKEQGMVAALKYLVRRF